MITYKVSMPAAAGILLVLSTASAWAQQRIEEAGMDVVVRDYQVSELEKGHNVIIANEKGITVTDEPSNPLHMTAVDCTGIAEEFSDGKFKGTGYCTNTDREGHKIVFRWNVNSAAAGPRYEAVAGTGKFEGAKAEGTVTITEVTPGPQGRQVARWKGWAEYPNVRK